MRTQRREQGKKRHGADKAMPEPHRRGAMRPGGEGRSAQPTKTIV